MHEQGIMKLKAIHAKNLQDWSDDQLKQLPNEVNSGKLQMNFTSCKSNTPCIKELTVNGVSINKSTDLANVLNEHFGTVGLKS